MPHFSTYYGELLTPMSYRQNVGYRAVDSALRTGTIRTCIMVVTRLLEVTSKGSEWVNAQSATTTASIETKPTTGSPSQPLNSSSSSYWNYATTTIQDMASNAIGSMVSSLYGGGNCISAPVNNFNIPQQLPQHHLGNESKTNVQRNTSYLPSFLNFSLWNYAASAPSSSSSSYRSVEPSYVIRSDEDGYDYEEDDILYNTPRNSAYPSEQQRYHHRRRSSIFAFNANDTSPWLSNSNSSGKNATPHSDLVWMFRNNKNPYNAVRGRESQLSSLTAVRSLVALVATTTATNNSNTILNEESEKSTLDDNDNKPRHVSSLESLDVPPPPPPPYEMLHDDSLVSRNRENLRKLRTSRQNKIGVSTPSETASQLAEGTIRALRDLALEEAVELQEALRYWNYRWERPLLSWLEAGPFGTIVIVVCLHF